MSDEKNEFAKDRQVCNAAIGAIPSWALPYWENQENGLWWLSVDDDDGGNGSILLEVSHPGRTFDDFMFFVLLACTRWPAALDRIAELETDIRASQLATAEAEALVISHEGWIAELVTERDSWKRTAEVHQMDAIDAKRELAKRPTEWAYEQVCATVEKYRTMFGGGSADENKEKLARLRETQYHAESCAGYPGYPRHPGTGDDS